MSAQLLGVDVSKWQGSISWADVARTRHFALIKATEGALPTSTSDAEGIKQLGLDPDFRANWSGAHGAGLVRGAYHFGRPDLGNTPEQEAEWFLSRVNVHTLLPGDLLALDLEMGAGNLASWAARFLGTVYQAAGFPPLFYASPNFCQVHGITFAALHGSYGLWGALWPAGGLAAGVPAPWAGWPVLAIWQYGSAGTVPGIAGRPDGDVFNGTAEELAKYGKPAPPQPPAPPAPPPQAFYSFEVLEWQPSTGWGPSTEGGDLHPPDGIMPLSSAKYLADRWLADYTASAAAAVTQEVLDRQPPAGFTPRGIIVRDSNGVTVYGAPSGLGDPQP